LRSSSLHEIRAAFILTFDDGMESLNAALTEWSFALVGAVYPAFPLGPAGRVLAAARSSC
jgi:hypothetical protein